MLIAGAGGHAREVLEVLTRNGELNVVFFDDITANIPPRLYNRFPVISTFDKAEAYFNGTDKRFILGIGGTSVRQQLANTLKRLGGILHSVISNTASISQYDLQLASGINIMQKVIIQPHVTIGEGTLVNAGALIHHDCEIGEYCEICPAVAVTGKCIIGDFTFIGTGAIITPGVSIGHHVIIGAGSVVTKDVADGSRVAGIPAKAISIL